MPASRTGEKSAIQTGVSQLVLSLATFGALAGMGAGGVYLFGDDEAGGPTVEIALFSAQNGPPPLLKARLDNAAPELGAGLEPTLPGVEYQDGLENV